MTAVGTGVVSAVVERLKVPELEGFVTPSSVMVTAVLAAIVLPLLSQHSRLGSVSREQKPTVRAGDGDGAAGPVGEAWRRQGR